MKKFKDNMLEVLCTLIGIPLMLVIGGMMCIVIWIIELVEFIRNKLRRRI